LDPLRVKAIDGQGPTEEIGEPLRCNTELAPYAMVLPPEAKSDLKRDSLDI
jgi:hypothetical protein